VTISLDERLGIIEQRLARIESKFNLTSIPLPSTTPQPSPPKATTSVTNQPAQATMESGNLLGIIAIICFVLAGGFIIKLSIDSGWLTPARQIGIAALFGFSLIGLGLRLLRVDREYASLLPAAGIIVLYLAIFAAHRYYTLISFEWAMGLSIVISLICISLYLRIKHDLYPIVAAVGTYLSPHLLGFNVDSYFSLYYFVLCSLTFAMLSILVNSRILTMISAYLAILVTASLGSYLHQDKLIAQILALQFIIFSIGTYLYSLYHKQSLTEDESWCFFPVLLLFYGAEYYYLSFINENLAAWISLAFATFLIVLYLVAKKTVALQNIASQPMIFTFVAIVCFHSGYMELLPAADGPWLFAASFIAFAFLPNRYTTAKHNILFSMPIIALIFLVIAIEYAKMVLMTLSLYQFFFNQVQPISWLAIFCSILSLWIVFIKKNNYLETKQGYGYNLLSAAHFLVILSLYHLTDDYGSLAVSASWLTYATAVILFAFVRKDKIMANSALLILFVSTTKALLYDAKSAPTIIRILCLILTGAVLYGAGLLFKKIAEWKK